MKLLIMGPPGAGKGTQAKKITERFNLLHLSTGDIFRNNIREKTELGRKVEGILAKGQLVPDEVTIDLVVDKLKDISIDNFLLDGFPRNINQAEALDKFLKENNEELDYVLNIEVDSDLLIKRLAGRRVCTNCGATYHIINNPPKVEGICDVCGEKLIQREDDNEETIKDRIKVYENETAPLIDYYKKSDKLRSIDGSKDVDEVFKEIQEILVDEF